MSTATKLKAGSLYRTKRGFCIGPICSELDGVLLEGAIELDGNFQPVNTTPTPMNTPALQLQIGKRYVTKDGQITGPLERSPNNLGYPFFDPVTRHSYTEAGVYHRFVSHPNLDLVSEYVEPTTPSEPPFTNTSLGKLLDEKSDAALSAKLDAFKSTAWEALDKVAPRHRWTNVSVEFKTPQRVSVVDLLRMISEAIRKQDLESARRDFVDEFLRRVDGLSKQVDNLHEEIDTLRR